MRGKPQGVLHRIWHTRMHNTRTVRLVSQARWSASCVTYVCDTCTSKRHVSFGGSSLTLKQQGTGCLLILLTFFHLLAHVDDRYALWGVAVWSVRQCGEWGSVECKDVRKWGVWGCVECEGGGTRAYFKSSPIHRGKGNSLKNSVCVCVCMCVCVCVWGGGEPESIPWKQVHN